MRALPCAYICVIFCFIQVRGWTKYHLGQKVGGLPPPRGPDLGENEIEEKYFPQPRQHFNLLLNDFWQQRYFVNDEYFNTTKANVVFLVIGGSEEASKKWMKYGVGAEAAKEHGALLFMLEHRHYGKSQPYNQHTTANLRLLTTHQALEDLARFITGMNEEYNLPSDVQWYAVGGFYAGSLAVWLRARYPHLLAGAVAVSAPLQPVLDFPEYLQVVADNLRLHSPTCVDKLQQAFQQLDRLANERSPDEMTSILSLCDPFQGSSNSQNPKDGANLFQILSQQFASVAQFQNIEGIWDITTDTLCDMLEDDTIGTELDRLGAITSLILERNGEECLEHKYDKMVAHYQNVTVTEIGNMQQWFHQTCNDFAWYPTSNQVTQVFGDRFPTTFFVELCSDVFGYSRSIIDTGIETMYNRYGGKDVQVSNVIFVHGTLDPWYPLGITQIKESHNTAAIFIKGTAHCAALYPESDNDTEELKQSRNEIFNTLKLLINGQRLNVSSDQTDDVNAFDFDPCRSRGNRELRILSIIFIVVVALLVGITIILGIKVYNAGKGSRRHSISSKLSGLPEKNNN